MLKVFPQGEKEFLQLAQNGGVISVYKELSADLETPLSVFLKIREGSYSFLLESVEKGQHIGHYSFIGTNPKLILKAKNGEIELWGGGENIKYASADPLKELEKYLKKDQPLQRKGVPPFSGGAVGFLSYEIIRYYEEFRRALPEINDFPDCLFMFPDVLLVFDHVRQVIQIITDCRVTDNPSGDYSVALEKLELVERKLQRQICQDNYAAVPQVPKVVEVPATDSEHFQAMVRKAKEQIKTGSISQVVLSRRKVLQLKKDPLEIYRSLRSLNPSSYMFYLEMADLKLIGSSPETLVKVTGEEVETRPVAGTRARSENELMEKHLEAELLANKKERAEHLMLVTLGCNDLDKVCKQGSVKIDKLMEIEKCSSVMHLVSRVRGELAPGKTSFDALRACFPAGTVSGTPRTRAIELISELEQQVRGPYAGAVGYFSNTGDIDTCITIRTIVVKKDKVYIQAGAGIVADSDSASEYAETEKKAEALFKALEK